jgi:asparagine synthase (glutamine-hydrolysing)
MFAFAIWDTRRRQILLARDRLGIKPLYYYERDGTLLFASELKPILQLADVERSLDWESVGHLFTTLATPSTRSIVKGVSKLEPARFAVGAQGGTFASSVTGTSISLPTNARPRRNSSTSCANGSPSR